MNFPHRLACVAASIIFALSTTAAALSPLPVIEKIIISGNTTIATETIARRLSYHEGGRFDKAKSAASLRSVHALGAFKQVALELEEGENDTITLYLTLTERPTLTAVSFDGNSALSDKKLHELTGSANLKYIDTEIGALLAEKMKKEYRENDYHHVEITPEVVVDPARATHAQIHFTIKENSKTHIKRIHFRGNTVIPSRVLRTYLQTRENWLLGFLTGAGKFEQEAFEIDKERIRMLYADRGYFAARVTDTNLTYSDNKKDIDIVFTVQEGACFSVKNIEVAPDPDIPNILLRRCLTLQKGDVYKQSEIHKMMESIKKLYGEYGFIDAFVSPQVIPDTKENSIDIVFHVNKGKKWRLNRLLITGNESTHDHVIRRQVMLEEGSPITGSAMDASKRAVEYLSYFDREGLEWRKHPLDNDLIDLELHVKEKPSREINTGLDFGPSKENPRAGLKGFFKADLRNMFGRGWDTGINLRVTKKHVTKPHAQSSTIDGQTPTIKPDKAPEKKTGFPFELSQFSYYISDPYLFGTNMSGHLSVSYAKSTYDQWNWVNPVPQETTFGITGRLGTRVPQLPGVSIVLEAGFEKISNNNTLHADGSPRLDIINVHTREKDRFRMLLDQKLQPGSMEWVGVDLIKDTRNHMMYPNDGYRLAFSTKMAPPGLNKTFSFIKTTLDTSWYTPLIGYDTLVLGLHAFAGYVEQVGPSYRQPTTENGVTVIREKSRIPYRELFNLGGQNTIRGFNWGEVGPSWDFRNPLGGRKAIQLNAELIFPLLDNYDMKVHLFYDAGCAWDTPKTSILRQYEENIKSNSFRMRHTVGIGLNITRPQPIKLSFGYKLDRNKKNGESPSEFHIGMNAAF